MIVLLWLLPVLVNIILPLAVFCFWSVGRLLHLVSHGISAAKADSSVPQQRQIPSAAGN
jgi:hypothetical protein